MEAPGAGRESPRKRVGPRRAGTGAILALWTLQAASVLPVGCAGRDSGCGPGLRGGALFVASAEEGEWRPAPLVGVCYRHRSGPASRVSFEFGLDTLQVTRDDGLIESALYELRGEALWPLGRSLPAQLMVVGGAVLSVEDQFRDGDTSTAGGAHAGLQLGPAGGRWDARAVYRYFLGDGNVRSDAVVAVGVWF